MGVLFLQGVHLHLEPGIIRHVSLIVPVGIRYKISVYVCSASRFRNPYNFHIPTCLSSVLFKFPCVVVAVIITPPIRTVFTHYKRLDNSSPLTMQIFALSLPVISVTIFRIQHNTCICCIKIRNGTHI